MTRKERILRLMQRQHDDVTYEQVIYHLEVMKDVEISMEQIARGEVSDHDELFAELLGENAKNQDGVVGSGQSKSQEHSGTHRERRPAKSGRVRKAPQERGRAAKKVP